MRPPHVSLLLLCAAPVLAQANAVPGTDVNLYNVADTMIWGRRGTHPNGDVGLSFGHGFCNGGTVDVPWQTSPMMTGPMTDVHFKIAFLVARESNGRMVQVSQRDSHVKHSRVTYNLGSSQCGTCQSGSGSFFYTGCYDAYTTGYNGNRMNLGPSSEIDPWLGSWNPVGSYFDRGDPVVAGAQANDGTQSLTPTQISAWGDPVKNTVTVGESELLQSGSFFGQVQLVCEGEPVGNRGNNLLSDQMTFAWNGSQWSMSNIGNPVSGSVLNRWTGATTDMGGNGVHDGRFVVGVKVTPLGGGQYHYEYAVHNVDNHRGGASLRIPVDAVATVTNAGFRDIDANALNEWTFTRTATEISFTAAASNALDWNNIFNFWFDCSVAPGVGAVRLDQARLGAGAIDVSVPSQVPSGVPVASVTSIGTSCGACDDAFYENFGTAGSIDLAGLSMTMTLASGQYTVGSGTSAWIAPAGTPLALGDDSEATVALPFPLPYPGGTTTQLRVCSNGFISPGASNGTSYTPSVSALLGGNPRWAAAWHDINPGAAGSGPVLVQSTATRVVITWNAVANWAGGTPLTFQYQFLPNGTVHVRWQVLATTGNGYVVGWSPGNVADPGSRDLSATLPSQFQLCAGNFAGMALTSSARPILGTTIQLNTTNLYAGSPFGLTVLSLTQALPPVNLAQYGMPGCFAHVVGGVNQLWFAPGASVAVPFVIPNDPGLASLSIVGQSFAYSPPLTPLGLVASNGLVLLLGQQ